MLSVFATTGVIQNIESYECRHLDVSRDLIVRLYHRLWLVSTYLTLYPLDTSYGQYILLLLSSDSCTRLLPRTLSCRALVPRTSVRTVEA